MKKGILFAFLILLTVILSGMLHSLTIKKISKASLESLTLVSQKLGRKEYDSARNEFYNYREKWKKKKDTLAFLITHEEIDAITHKNAQLSACFNDEAETEAFSIIGELHELFLELEQKFSVNLKNILQIRSVFI